MLVEERVSWRRRISRAIGLAVFNILLWIVLPNYLLSYIGETSATSGLITYNLIFEFGAAITGLQVLGALSEGTALSAPFTAGSYITEAYYLWVAGSGGTITVEASGVQVTLEFQTLLFLLMLPSLFSVARVALAYLLDASEAGRPASDII
jgi:hypothetical protein